MSLDSFTIAALVDEFNAELTNGRIQDTVQIERETFGFEIYADHERKYLLLSADAEQPRALISPEKLRRGVEKPSTLGLLLRTRVEGMFISAIEQPTHERMIVFHLVGRDQEMQLILELIGRNVNLILIEDGQIIECARRVSGKDNRYRIILPKHEYVAPPAQELQLMPQDVDPESLAHLFNRESERKAWQTLVSNVLGFSPQLAKEIVYRHTGSINTVSDELNAESFYQTFHDFVTPLLKHDWQYGMITENGLPKSVASYEVTHTGEWQSYDTMSEALNARHGELEGAAAYEAAKVPIRKQLENAFKRVNSKIYSMNQQFVDDEKVEELRKSGELILAYQYAIEDGQEVLSEQYDPEGEPLKIKLDTDLTPLENSQAYFEKYDKAKRAREALPKRIALAKNEKAMLEQLDADLDFAENWQEIGEVQDTLQKMGYWRGKKTSTPKSGRSAPLKFVTNEGFVIWVGRNSRQNEQVTWEKGTIDDLWMHARGIPGSHVIIKSNGQEVPDSVLEKAAGLAAYYSKARNDGKVLVMVAERRYLQKPKRGNPGQVLVRQELSSITAVPTKSIDG